jgi:hypothetical protein
MALTKGGASMLWYCRFTWYPGVTREQVAKRVVQQDEAGRNYPENIRAWYNLVGGGAGFLLIETDDPNQVTAFLQPYMDLMSWEVFALHELDYSSEIERLRRVAQGTT